MAAATDLVFLSGPLEGTRLELDPKETLRLGRKRTGVDLEDPLVSLDHASVTYGNDGYWITDLGSASGTFVNGTELGEAAVRLKLGDLIRIGESELRVAERPIQNLLRMVLIVCIILASMPLVYHFVQNQPLAYDPTVSLRGEVNGADGPHQKLTVPKGFIRREGVDHRGLQHTNTTDIDNNGVDEVWLSSAVNRYVISLDARGAWTYHGSVATTCRELPGTTAAPEFDCGGIRWRWRDGKYIPLRLDGLVVWTREGKGKPVRPFVVPGVNEPELVGWLQARGVNEPIHYLLCEGFIPGAPPQVLTTSGAVRPLSKGCLREVRVDAQGLSSGPPAALAFTAAGAIALKTDAFVHLSGGEEGAFIGRSALGVRDSLRASPVVKLRGKVQFEGETTDGDALAGETATIPTHALIRSEDNAKSPVVKAQLLSAGTARLAGGGCVELEVSTENWSCSLGKACRSGSTFLSVDEVGCGARTHLLTVPYSGGRVYGKSGAVEVIAEVASEAERVRTDVLRTQIYIRPTTP